MKLTPRRIRIFFRRYGAPLTVIATLVIAAGVSALVYVRRHPSVAPTAVYTVPHVGLSFQLPAGTVVADTPDAGSAYTVIVTSSPITDQNAAEKEALQKDARTTASADEIGNSEELLHQGSVNAKTYLSLTDYSPCNLVFARQVIYYYGEKRVTVSFVGRNADITASMPGYFATNKACSAPATDWNWTADPQAPDTFYTALKNHAASGAATAWFEAGNQFVSSVSIH